MAGDPKLMPGLHLVTGQPRRARLVQIDSDTRAHGRQIGRQHEAPGPAPQHRPSTEEGGGRAPAMIPAHQYTHAFSSVRASSGE
jgi:hypothetical protein